MQNETQIFPPKEVAMYQQSLLTAFREAIKLIEK